MPEKKQPVVLNGVAFELVVPCDDNVYGSGNENGFYQIITNTDGSHNVMIRYSLYIIRGYQLPTLKKPILTEAIDKSSMNWKMEAQ